MPRNCHETRTPFFEYWQSFVWQWGSDNSANGWHQQWGSNDSANDNDTNGCHSEGPCQAHPESPFQAET
jgi:hypothetical protein